ncbi:hypothetical protein J3R30DRAFT_3684850 [Lentinula aciculospora]|uniref:Uncharacterized protein n=1 Tax=Lentinula aciculospora TaxID=153920 RepID=A0A9W9A2J4_9AGAR|nr:hypothetical protein J3R30DRAFT_3684850 [Lentinula aciculospora]
MLSKLRLLLALVIPLSLHSLVHTLAVVHPSFTIPSSPIVNAVPQEAVRYFVDTLNIFVPGPYEDVTYTANWIVVGNQNSVLSPFPPHSYPNVIIVRSSEVGANRTLPGSGKLMTLIHFYFGCPLYTGEGIATLSATCTLKVTGIHKGEQVATKTYQYEDGQNMTLVNDFDVTFTDVDEIQFLVVKPGVGITLAVDSVAYDLYDGWAHTDRYMV